jgi:hypothetical protein
MQTQEEIFPTFEESVDQVFSHRHEISIPEEIPTRQGTMSNEDVQSSLGVLLGMMSGQGQDTKLVFKRLELLDGRVYLIEKRIEITDARLVTQDRRLDEFGIGQADLKAELRQVKATQKAFMAMVSQEMTEVKAMMTEILARQLALLTR